MGNSAKVEEVKLEQPMATGRTAEIYAWQGGQVLKLFFDWFSLENIAYEARIARAIHASGLPVPAVGEILQVNGRNGLVYQRVEGQPMSVVLSRKPWMIYHYARRMAAMHAEMHTTSLQVEIPSQKERLIRKIQGAAVLPGGLRDKALKVLETQPEGNRLCHGDFHPLNILVTAQGETIIDWIDATRGNPLADVARTTIILLGAAACQVKNPFEIGFSRWFTSIYLEQYFELRPGGQAEYNHWLPVVAAARLSEQIPELETWLVKRSQALLET